MLGMMDRQLAEEAATRALAQVRKRVTEMSEASYVRRDHGEDALAIILLEDFVDRGPIWTRIVESLEDQRVHDDMPCQFDPKLPCTKRCHYRHGPVCSRDDDGFDPEESAEPDGPDWREEAEHNYQQDVLSELSRSRR